MRVTSARQRTQAKRFEIREGGVGGCFFTGTMKWSHDGKFIATRNDSMPGALWIWDCGELALAAVLLQDEDVVAFAWDAEGHRLAVCTGCTRVYLWSPEGASCIHVPLPSFRASNVAWSPAGASFVLTDKDAFCCAFLS
mmetsp:Transcript_37048/g.88061  ORF Transcript_37048/g.88061 Transcript_37048/m.88061 type:complete len:139 (+) Transcript_37048:1135-1551(+)